MTSSQRSAELARLWIESWAKMDMDWLRQHLATGFVHTSPFGRLEGRDHYLATVEPLARSLLIPEVSKEGGGALGRDSGT